MAEALLSSVLSKGCELQATIRRSASSSSDPRRCVEEDLKQLMRLLPRIQASLCDAEEREVRDASVKLWLTELEDVAYEAEDVLDEYQYEFLRAQVEGRAAAAEACRKSKFVEEGEEVRASTSSSSSLLPKVSIPSEMADRIREIRSRFDEISKDREALRLREEDGERRARATYPPPTGHLVDESAVYGREQEKKELIDLLLSENKENTLSVIPIVGTGGLGKTTLAQLVYNDPSVKQHFNLRGWVCVSEDFDVMKVTKAIVESVTGQPPCNFTQLSSLQNTLREKLNGRNVLLVLDDVWNEQRCYWESLQAPFLGSGAVSIIVTTRNLSVAEIMQTIQCPYYPDYLPEDKCWQLFQWYAFRGRDPKEYPILIEIGQQIVRKCRGLPLAVKTLGGLLQHESDEDSWENILESDLWELHHEDNEILAALRLSYNWMPVYLKPCFLFLSVYPKDHQYEIAEVARLWFANGYFQPRGSMTVEDVGEEYLVALLKRSILDVHLSSGGTYYFVMHDMVHDLARSISGMRCLSSGDGVKLCDRSEKVQHLYLGPENYQETVDSLCHNCTVLRTLLAPRYYSSPMCILPMIQWTSRLRALCLDAIDFEEMPPSVGYLKHLRYLRIMSTYLRSLPDSMCRLYNLQILEVITPALEELPRDLGNLINLYYMYVLGGYKSLPDSICKLQNLHKLDCANSDIRELPVGIGDLKNLCHLSLPYDGYVCLPPGFGKLTNLWKLGGSLSARTENMQGGIGELKDLANIEGSLAIRDLRGIGDIAHAKDASLKNKNRLEELVLGWGDGNEPIDEETEEMVLQSLQPHTNLNNLSIEGYGGARFPSWLGDPSFSKLTHVTLECEYQKTIVNLPSLSQLPSLVSLTIQGMFKIPRMEYFPCLTELNLNSVDGLEEWFGVPNDAFPCLRRLQIVESPNLMRLSTVPTLEDIEIGDCESLTSLVLWNGRPSMLRMVQIEHCPQLTSVVGLHKLDCLEDLSLVRCWQLTSLAGLQGLTSLTRLKLERCPNLRLHPNGYLRSVPNKVEIIDCPRLTEWCKTHQFTYVQKILGQESLTITKFKEIPSNYEAENLSSLKYLCLAGCGSRLLRTSVWLPPTLETIKFSFDLFSGSLSLLQNLSILKRLEIAHCPRLDSVVGLSELHYLEELEIHNCPKLQLPQQEPLPAKLRDVRISECGQLTSLAGLQDLTSLRSLFLEKCPKLQLQPNECLRSAPDRVEIIECPGLMEWCRTNGFPYSQVFYLTYTPPLP